ncbi:MAG: nucleotidyltransferase family protein [Phycisphaerae bacterium]
MEEQDAQLVVWLRARKPSEVSARRAPTTENGFLEAARRAGVAGLLLEHASRYDLPLPVNVADELRQRAMVVGAANMSMAGELERVVEAFNHGGVPVMLLKGAALNLTVYKRPDLRPMSDLDLLIEPHRAADAVRLLLDRGCRRGFDLMREDFFPKYHYEIELMTHSPRPARIDLHARPLRPLRVSRTMPDNAFWKDAQVVGVGESEAVIPRPETMFIHLAAHAAFHGCPRLLWLYDIKRLADECGEAMDWSLVTRRARDWRLSLPVLQAIERTAEVFGPVCPEAVTDELAAHKTSWRDQLTLAHAPRDATSPIGHVVVNLLCTPGIRFRAGYVMAMLLPGRAHLAGLYPWRHPGWIACAHARRSIRAFGRLVSAPWNGLVRAVSRIGHLREHRCP